MKKRLLLVIMAAVMLLTMLAGCNNADSSLGIKTPEDGLKTEEPANNPDGDTPEKEEIKPLEDDSDYNLENEYPAESDSSTSPVDIVIHNAKLNADVFSGFGMTYPQLKEKYGKAIRVTNRAEGGRDFYFENGFGGYAWGMDSFALNHINEEMYIFDGSKTEYGSHPIPFSEIECKFIHNISVKDLFLNSPEAMTANQIEKYYGMKHDESGTYNYEYITKCFSDFSYNGLGIYIGTDEEGIITHDSIITIRYPG